MVYIEFILNVYVKNKPLESCVFGSCQDGRTRRRAGAPGWKNSEI